MALRELLARFRIQVSDKPLQKLDNDLKGIRSQFSAFGAALSGALAVAGIARVVDNIREAGDAIDKSSQQVGFSVKEFQGWSFAAGQAGVSQEQFADAARVAAKNMYMARGGTGAVAETIKELGVSVTDTEGNLRSMPDILLEVGGAIGEMTNKTEASAVASTVFGRSGAKMLPLLNSQKEGIKELLAQFEELGGGMTEDAIEQSAKLTDAQGRFQVVLSSLSSTIAVQFFPILTRAIDKLGAMLVWINNVTKDTSLMRAILTATGVAGVVAIAKIVKAFGPLLRITGKYMLMFALIVLVIDDLINLFEGNDSLIGRVIDNIFGEGASTKAVDAIKKAWKEVMPVVKETLDRWINDNGAFKEDMDLLWDTLQEDAWSFWDWYWSISGDAGASTGKWLRETHKLMWEYIKDVGSDAWDFILDSALWSIDMMSEAIAIIADSFTAPIDAALRFLGILDKGSSIARTLGFGSDSRTVSTGSGGSVSSGDVNVTVNTNSNTPAAVARATAGAASRARRSSASAALGAT